MSGKDFLKYGIEYGLWANKHWLSYLDSKQIGNPDRGIFEHILAAQYAWLLRCEGTQPSEPPKVEATVENLEDHAQRWLEMIDKTDLETWIDYKRYNGDANKMQFGTMVHHVINHGTYHRGELRGLCRARGDEEFQDTDIATYAFESGKAVKL